MIHRDSLQFAVKSPGAVKRRFIGKSTVLSGVLAPELSRIVNLHEYLPEMAVLTQWINTYSLLPYNRRKKSRPWDSVNRCGRQGNATAPVPGIPIPVSAG